MTRCSPRDIPMRRAHRGKKKKKGVARNKVHRRAVKRRGLHAATVKGTEPRRGLKRKRERGNARDEHSVAYAADYYNKSPSALFVHLDARYLCPTGSRVAFFIYICRTSYRTSTVNGDAEAYLSSLCTASRRSRLLNTRYVSNETVQLSDAPRLHDKAFYERWEP